MWQLYDSFVPLFLQAGHPKFETSREVLGFGLSATLTGSIMGIDNLVAIFVLPLIGIWSDRARTRIGRRYPFIVTAAPVGALAFVLIPIAARMIDPQKTGSIIDNIPAFVFFMIGAGLMLLECSATHVSNAFSMRSSRVRKRSGPSATRMKSESEPEGCSKARRKDSSLK